MGFAETWIRWIMSYVNSVTYSVLVNDQPHGLIKPERGIRQGHPISPFLFILCVEALVHTINKSEAEKEITGARANVSGLTIHHLLFADDSLLLCKATVSESLVIKRCLQMYEDASGQRINFQKSSIFFGKKVKENVKILVKYTLGINTEGGEGVYLGLPECFSGSKSNLLSFIRENL